MENGRIKEKKNRQEFEHNLPGLRYKHDIVVYISLVSVIHSCELNLLTNYDGI